MVSCYIWIISLYGSKALTLRKLDWKYLKCFEIRYWRRTEKIKWSEKITNEEGIGRVEEKRALLNNTLRRKVNCQTNCLFHETIEGKMKEGGRHRKKKNAIIWLFEKQKIFGAKGGSWRLKNVGMKVNHMEIRKKYNVYSKRPCTC